MNSELRPHQIKAMDAIRQSLSAGRRRIVLQAPTGSGKTVLAAAIVDGALRKGKRVIFTVPALSLVDQTVEKFWAEGITDIGVIQADHGRTNFSRQAQVASVQTLMKRHIPEADVVVVDECFAAGTLVATPYGDHCIETIREGEYVNNALGVGRVLSIVRQFRQAMTLELSNGQSIRVTADHPMFTACGWKKAGELESGSRLFSIQAMHRMRRSYEAMDWQNWKSAGRGRLEHEALLLWLLCEEARESNAELERQTKDVSQAAGDWAPPFYKRWQRDADANLTKAAANSVGSRMGGGMCDPDQDGEKQRLSDLLQDRSRQSRASYWNRDRRRITSQHFETGSRQEEVGAVGDVWVENISRDEHTCDEPVYNLRVEGHPSYFAGGVLVHNCHRWFTFYEKWFLDQAWKQRPFIGLSATPWTRGLGKYYDDLIIAATTQELIDAEYLSPFKVFAPSHPDLSKVRTIAGDYHEGDLSDVMGNSVLVADVVDTWKQRGENRSTLCFAVDRAHAKHLQEKFTAAGVTCGYIDAYTPIEERSEIAEKFAYGEYRVVCNVGCLTTGIDWDVRCIILARPTKSEMLYVQIIGRGLRTAEAKDDCLILDHSDTTLRLGFVTDIHHDALDDGKPKAAAKTDRVPLPKECPECAFLKPPRVSKCPNCGHAAQKPIGAEHQDGELVELKPERRIYSAAAHDDKLSFYAQLKYICVERGYKEGWAANKYREKFGAWPVGMKGIAPSEPTPQTRSWIKHTQIAWSKSKSNPANSQASFPAS